jgi:hypothetical protein
MPIRGGLVSVNKNNDFEARFGINGFPAERIVKISDGQRREA